MRNPSSCVRERPAPARRLERLPRDAEALASFLDQLVQGLAEASGAGTCRLIVGKRMLEPESDTGVRVRLRFRWTLQLRVMSGQASSVQGGGCARLPRRWRSSKRQASPEHQWRGWR